MAIKDDKVIAKIPANEKAELVDMAETLDIPISQIVREAVREKVLKMQRTHPKLKNRPAVETA